MICIHIAKSQYQVVLYVSRWNRLNFHCFCFFIPDGNATMMTTVEIGRMNAIVVSTTKPFNLPFRTHFNLLMRTAATSIL